MSNIEVSISNSLLPFITIETIILKNNSIEITYKAEAQSSVEIENFTNIEYFKYLEISFTFNGVTVTDTIQQLPSTKTVVISLDEDTQFVGEQSVLFATSFDYERIRDDYKLDSGLWGSVFTLLGNSNLFSYPVLDDTNLVIDPLFYNGVEEQTKVIDYRKSVNFLTQIKIEVPIEVNSTSSYVSYLGSSTYGEKIGNFFQFNYGRYLQENSLYGVTELEEFSIFLSISNDTELIDIVSISKSISNPIVLASRYNQSVSINNFNNTIIFVTYDKEESSNRTRKLKVSVNYTDNSITIYEKKKLNYNIYKNYIILSEKYSGYSYDLVKPNPFYLLLDNNKFTQEFINLCNEQNIDIITIVADLINLINKFSSTGRISDRGIKTLQNNLSLSKTTFHTSKDFVNIIDVILQQIENILYFTNPVKQVKTLNIQRNLINEFDYYYKFNDILLFNEVPILDTNIFIDILNKIKNNNIITPSYLVTPNKILNIGTTIEFGDEVYNSTLSYISSKKENRYFRSDNIIPMNEDVLEKVFKEFSVSYSSHNNPTITKMNTQTNTVLPNDQIGTIKATKSINKLKLSSISTLDTDVKINLKNDNKLIHGVLSGIPSANPKVEEVVPQVIISYYETTDNTWKPVTKSFSFTKDILIRTSFVSNTNSMYSNSNIYMENLHLDSNYFIVRIA